MHIIFNFHFFYYTKFSIKRQIIHSLKTYKITKIGNTAFYRCGNITSVTIPDSVTEIEDGDEGANLWGAFAFSGITSIELPNSITKIGDFAFFDCQQLTSANIPENVTTIGEAAFCWCENENLSITIPDSVTTIEINAFGYVNNIYYQDREELKNQEGYPYWGAYKSNGTYNPAYEA